MLAVDVHQHLWPEGVLRGLERRHVAPHARWRSGAWELTLAGEPAFPVDPVDHDPARRAAALRAAGLDQVLLALSTPVGIEALAPDEAAPLLDAWEAEARTLPPGLETWASVPVLGGSDEVVARATAALDAGAVGVVLAAGALTRPHDAERLGPLLALLEARLSPLFLHPGPAARAQASGLPPAWWGPTVGYVAELHAAWHAVSAWVRPAHPRLAVLFAALAGLAPVHAERTALRGGPASDDPDPLLFYDVSSYGARALRAMRCAVGTAQLVHGTDAPVVDPAAAAHDTDLHRAMSTTNPARMLGRLWAPGPVDRAPTASTPTTEARA